MISGYKWVRKTSVKNVKGWTRYTLSKQGQPVIAYIDKSGSYKDYYAFVDCNPYNMLAHLLGRFKYLKDAKMEIERYYKMKRK